MIVPTLALRASNVPARYLFFIHCVPENASRTISLSGPADRVAVSATSGAS